jgi:hypothetical protein
MSAELDELLLSLLKIAIHKADRIPTPFEPADDVWEQAADEYCLRFARTNEAEMPSPEVACALIPRLRVARQLATIVEHSFSQRAALGDFAATERELVEALLVIIWRDTWKARWRAGEIEWLED